ncbi:MAG: hypothetical protein GXP35_08375, partial [Actinobacteria bacterium]|nr:hypothetical protein [Actinomycetota bacterium]
RLLVSTAIAAIVVIGASPALADEFAVGILIEPGLEGSDGVAFMQGFQLAVDQSPDVSHPPGVEGGDHLGSMDVVFVIADGIGAADGIVGAALDMTDTEQLPIIVAHVSNEALATIIGLTTDSETVLIAASNADAGDFGESVFLFAIDGGTAAIALLDDRQPGFRGAFLAAYGFEPTPPAMQGYLAGRLVDIGVEATDRDPYDTETLMAALHSAVGDGAPNRAQNNDSALEPTAAQSSQEEQSSSGLPAPLVVGVLALLAIASAWIVFGRVNRRDRR